jgi:alkylhydroperoxidase family enzyme
VTNIQEGHAPDAVYDELRAHFDEVETVNLTLVITTMNAWNRIAISRGRRPEEESSGQGAAALMNANEPEGVKA